MDLRVGTDISERPAAPIFRVEVEDSMFLLNVGTLYKSTRRYNLEYKRDILVFYNRAVIGDRVLTECRAQGCDFP
jgi:hypothetical protein